MTVTKRATQLLTDLGHKHFTDAYVTVVECSLAAAECDGMERAARVLEKLAKGKPLGERVALQTAALHVRAAKWESNK